MARVIFLGTPAYAVPTLESLCSAHQVLAVITQPDQAAGRGRKAVATPPVKVWAAAHQLPVYQPPSLRRDTRLIAELQALKPDVLVLAAYGQLLRQNVLGLAPAGCIGVHASLLPRWRGAAPIAAAVLNGDALSGVSLMATDRGMDTGPVIAQASIAMDAAETTPSLTDKLAQLGAELVIDTLPGWLAGAIRAQPQDETLVTYAPPLTRTQGKLDWSLPAVVLERQVRALNPWPGTQTRWEGMALKITAAQVAFNPNVSHNPGRVVQLDGAIGVVTGQGVLLIRDLQPAGKRVMSAEAFVRGHSGFIGAQLSKASPDMAKAGS